MLIGLLVTIIIFIGYIIWENNRITIVDQEVEIKGLPEEFNGFSILQISDLHEEVFGENQEKLIETINSINYDAIVFTGDMLDGIKSNNYKPFYSILDGITNKKNAWYVPGNADPESYHVTEGIEKSEFVQGLEKRGVTFLESMDTVELSGTKINFVNFELAIGNIGRKNGIPNPSYSSSKKYITYQKGLLKKFDKITDENVIIALNHYPVVDQRIDQINNDSKLEMKDFDLLIAGHYHGGQIRLPLVGALFVPEAWSDNGGFFPPQDRVKGLWEYDGIQQYVSTGLGSSDAITFLNFRFFNPPQINVLKLKKAD
ncbi:metallophosphoesterase [Virgibacillus flavescens]|uniref:metallophosphoesterase n=1 Tax=Virgibacillus flavescens TaxID=1611422 RepID=UPI003D340DA9